MRILLISMNYAPEPVGVGPYSADIAEHLASRGHAVRVIAARPYFPHWDSGKFRAPARERTGGVDILRCPAWVPSRPRAASRLAHDLSFSLAACPALAVSVARKPELVLAVAPTLFAAFPALALARAVRARSVLHVQDLELDAAVSVGHLPPWMKSAAGWLERRALRGFDRLIAVSGEMDGQLRHKGVEPEKISIVRNWSRISSRHAADPLQARRRLGLSQGVFLVLYSGSMGGKQGLETLIAAARLAQDERIVFLLRGQGPVRARLEREAEGLGNVRFLELDEGEGYASLMCAADLIVIPQVSGPRGVFLPSKLADALAVGATVLAVADEGSELARIAAEGGGTVVLPDDPAALAEAVKSHMGRNTAAGVARARDCAEKYFSRREGLRRIKDIVESPRS
jgi:colanic acid biosynthesis glycosyl transferase WcaI